MARTRLNIPTHKYKLMGKDVYLKRCGPRGSRYWYVKTCDQVNLFLSATRARAWANETVKAGFL